MSEETYFQQALSNVVTEVAYAGAVRHLHDLGYSEERIRETIAYPASIEQIRRVIEAYEAKKNDPERAYEYVQEVDAYGKKTYRRVPKEQKEV